MESRESVLAGGNRGPAAEPGKPEESHLIQAIRFNGELKMPPTGKLPDKDIAVLERWVALGLPEPSSMAAKKESPAGECHALVLSTHPEARRTGCEKHGLGAKRDRPVRFGSIGERRIHTVAGSQPAPR